MLNQLAAHNQKSSFVDGLLEVIRVLGTWYAVNPDAAYLTMSAVNYEHGNRTVADDLLEEIIIRLSALNVAVGSVDISGKIDKTTNVNSIDQTGIEDGHIVFFNKTLKTLRSQNIFLSSNFAEVSTNFKTWTVKAVIDYVANQLASRITCVSVFADPTATGWTYTNMITSPTVFGGTDRHSFRFLTTKIKTVRLVTSVSVVGVTAAHIYLEYSGNNISWFKIGTGTDGDIISLFSLGKKETDWIELPVGAVGDVYFRIGCSDGDSVADPMLGHTQIQFRTA